MDLAHGVEPQRFFKVFCEMACAVWAFTNEQQRCKRKNAANVVSREPFKAAPGKRGRNGLLGPKPDVIDVDIRDVFGHERTSHASNVSIERYRSPHLFRWLRKPA